MLRKQAIVRSDQLEAPDQQAPIRVGSDAWYAWLSSASVFRFDGEEGTFGARRERFQRGGWYWRAYRRVNGRLRRAYLGRAADLTAERLRTVALELAGAPPEGAQPLARQHSASPMLLQTKLRPPTLRRGVIARPALLDALDSALQYRLTVVTAPAGYGKTTLLTQWYQELEHGQRHAHHPVRVAWLSLDDDDNDARRLWQYVIATLERVEPDVADVAPLLHLPALVNRLMSNAHASEALTLILDDYQAIVDAEIHEAVIQLVERMPDRLHVVLASRAAPPLPMARWRAAGYSLELHAQQLRFSNDESAAMLRDVSGRRLADEQLGALLARTEGWAAGLHLAGLALRGAGDLGSASTAMTSVSGSHPFILDYLVDEIVGRQPPYVQRFLLQTSILDRLNGDLCDAVMQPEASDMPGSHAMLEALERANLFIVALDEERRWFRYHQLFADALQAQLQRSTPELRTEAHRRAMEWYMTRLSLDTSSIGAAALEHALAAGLPERAIAVVETTAQEMLWYRGEMRTVLRWIDRLPEGSMRGRPVLQLARCWASLATLQFARLQDYVRQASRDAAQEPEAYAAALWEANLAAIESFVERINGHIEQGLLRGQEALALLPAERLLERRLVVTNLVNAYTMRGDIRAALDVVDAALEEGGDIDELPALIGHGGMVTARASLLVCCARLDEANDLLAQARREIAAASPRTRQMTGHAAGLTEQIEILYEWNDLERARQLAVQALEAGENWWNNDLQASASYWLGRVYRALGQPEAAAAHLKQSHDLGRSYNVPSLVREIEVYEAIEALHSGHLAPAAALMSERGLSFDDIPSGERFAEYELLARLGIAQGHADATLGLVGRLRSLAMEGEYTQRLIRVDLLWALALHAGSRTDEALAPLLLALTLAQPNRMVRIVVDEGPVMRELLLALQRRFRSVQATPALQQFVGAVLNVFDAAPFAQTVDMQPPEHLVEHLTAREVEVLNLIVVGASNQEIADTLVVSLHTAKKHVSSILAKLGVASRAQAAAKARPATS